MPEVLGLGPALLARARKDAEVWLAGSVTSGPAVLLGAVQRAGAVVDMAACGRQGVGVYRRATTGTAAWAGGRVLVWTLALPHVAALAPDATARTVLNRNVRGFLQGLTRAGALAQYYGREWVSVRRRPAALLGLEWSSDGAVLIEVVAGWDVPVALPAAVASEREKATERWRDKAPLALVEVVGERTPADVVRTVMDTVATRAGFPLEWASGGVAVDLPAAVTQAEDPVPRGLTLGPAVKVPVGWIEAASGRGPEDRRAWIGGDVLTGTEALAALCRGAAWGDAALEGALPEDLARALVHAHDRANGRA